MLGQGDAGSLLSEIRSWLYSNERSLGLRRDLEEDFQTPEAKIPLFLRPLRRDDVHELLDEHDSGSPNTATMELARRKIFIDADVPTCYVAVTEDGHPCYMQWLIGAQHNEQIQSHFKGGLFPVLKKNEGLLELAFAPEKYRGMRIMPHAMAEIAKKGNDFGARYIITFVSEGNIPSLKGCQRAGFYPYMARESKWRLFRRRCTFKLLPPNTRYSFDLEPKASKVSD